MTADRLVALVPMRHHSERVPGKNYRELGGKPLYAHILSALIACKGIDQIVVDTDSPIIAQGVSERYPQVHLIERPPELQGDRVSMNAVLLHDVQQVRADYYLQTHSTNPLLTTGTLSRAISRFLAARPKHDSLFSVTPMQTRLWTREGEPVNHDPAELLRTQDLPPLFEENSCIYIFERDAFLASGNRIGERPLLFEIDPGESLDIDEEFDFLMAQCLLEKRAQDS